MNEAWRTNGKGVGCRSGAGPTYEIFIDRPNELLDPSCSQTVWFNFYNFARYTGDPKLWADKFAQYIQHLNGNGKFYAEYGTIFEGAVVNEVLEPEPLRLVPVPVKAERLNSGTYHLAWTVPRGTKSYRIKDSDRKIVEWLNFDPVANRFGTDPTTSVPWFAASDITAPLPGPGETIQTYDVNGLDPKVQWHFALKAYVQIK